MNGLEVKQEMRPPVVIETASPAKPFADSASSREQARHEPAPQFASSIYKRRSPSAHAFEDDETAERTRLLSTEIN
jgi:hypothetical protein